MTISNLKRYLQQREQATLSDIANHFGAEPDGVLAMLEHWQKRGRIRRLKVLKCSGCKQRGCHSADLFRWER
jgi:predicted ArsR family transcriptional regulator